MPSSLNLPVRKREEKCRRREGKSQCRRGGPKSRAMQASAVSKTPSPATTPLAPPPPVVVPPPVATIPIPLQMNLLKDPTALSPNIPLREGKAIRRKEKVDAGPPKTTIRKKKNSATATQSISIDGKTSSENDGRIGSKNDRKKKNSQTSSDSGRKKSSMENKSDGSKEPSENDEKTGPKFNKDLAKNFFKHMLESQRARKRSDDARLETMPESSQINVSARALRKKIKKTQKTTLDSNYFKPNGEPVWVVPERAPDECVKTEDGVVVTNPDLTNALAEDGIELDERIWDTLVEGYIGGVMPMGELLPENHHFDSLAPFETLEATSSYVSPETVLFNTLKNMVGLSEDAMQRFKERKEGIDKITETTSKAITLPPKMDSSAEQFQLKTCVMSNVSFNMKTIFRLSYDRHHPIASIQKFRKKMGNTYSMEQTTQPESKEKI